MPCVVVVRLDKKPRNEHEEQNGQPTNTMLLQKNLGAGNPARYLGPRLDLSAFPVSQTAQTLMAAEGGSVAPWCCHMV